MISFTILNKTNLRCISNLKKIQYIIPLILLLFSIFLIVYIFKGNVKIKKCF